MKKKLNVILEDYVIPALFLLPIIAYVILLLGLMLSSSKATEAVPTDTPSIAESVAEANTEPDIVANITKKTAIIDISEEPTESIKSTENENETTAPTETEVDLVVELTDGPIESEYDGETIYFDIPLESNLQAYIVELCNARGIDPAIVMAMIYRESGYNAGAVGDSGNSLGLMQIMPRWNGDRMSELGCYDLLDPYQNVAVGIDCFADYFDQSGSIEWSLMAYNGGPSYANRKWNSGEISGYVYAVLSYADSIRNN